MSNRAESHLGGSVGPFDAVHPVDVEQALAAALVKATEAGRWDVVAQLGRELEARRLAGSNVVELAAASRKRGAS